MLNYHPVLRNHLLISYSCLRSYVLMSEPDHILVKPIPNLSRAGRGAAFPFSYIEPKKHETTLRKFFPEERGPVTKIDPIGNSPVIVGKVSLLSNMRLCPHLCKGLMIWFSESVIGCFKIDSSHLDEHLVSNAKRPRST